MSKLPRKLRIFRAKKRIRNIDIASATGASLQSVVNWASEARCPARIDEKHALALIALTNNYITMSDCGY